MRFFVIFALLAVSLAGCKREYWTITGSDGPEPVPATDQPAPSPRPEMPPEVTQPEPVPEPQPAKEVIFVLGIDGMD